MCGVLDLPKREGEAAGAAVRCAEVDKDGVPLPVEVHAEAVGDVCVAYESDTGLGHAGVCQRVALGEVGVEELFSAAA